MTPSTWRIFVAPSAAKDLAGFDKSIRVRLAAAIDALAHDPHPPGSIKLAGGAGEWRIRVGEYRIIYETHSGRLVVLVVRVAHRREVYR